MRPALALLLFLASLACGPATRDRDSRGSESTSTDDAGGTVGPDAGEGPGGDGGLPEDAGTAEDAGSTEDGGGTTEDAGSTVDAGESDGGRAPDAGPGGTVSGAVGGETFVPLDAVATVNGQSLSVELLSRENTCAVLEAGHYAAATEIAFFLNGEPDLIEGTYDLGSSPFGNWALFGPYSATCSAQVQLATSGSVVVTRLALSSGGYVEGSFDVAFGTERVTGTFRAARCGEIPAERSGCE